MAYLINRQTPLLALFSLSFLLSGCAAKVIDIAGVYPSPLVTKLPITVGVYYDDAFSQHHYIEINDNNGKDQYIINSGPSQVELFNTILPAVFTDVIVLESLDSIGNYPQLDAVFVPAIDEFQLGLPAKTRLDVYEVWLKYTMRLSTAEGDFIADWIMTAYGKTPQDRSIQAFQSVSDGVNDATVIALRDLAASFALNFKNIPEVNEWLSAEALPDE